MTIGELLVAVAGQAADGRDVHIEVVVLVGKEVRRVEASYMDHRFILVAGAPVPGF
jgi:hypothetical protein